MKDPIDRTSDASSPRFSVAGAFYWIVGLSVVALCATISRADIPGACCLPDGSCDTFTNSVSCVEVGGTFAGFGITCDNADCPPPPCDAPLELSACPQTIIFETSDVEGIEFDLPNLPTAEGCDPIVTIQPPLGEWLPVGETRVVVTAESESGESVSCVFVVVVDLVDEIGPIQKRRLKGGGTPTPDGGVCTVLSPLVGGASCGVCQFSGLLGTIVGMAAGRRRQCRRSRSRMA